MPLRRFRVKFADGTSEVVKADSLDEATAKARRSARKQISVVRQGRKQVASVKVEPGQATPPRSDPFRENQERVARQTLAMPGPMRGVMGGGPGGRGQTAAEARRVLKGK